MLRAGRYPERRSARHRPSAQFLVIAPLLALIVMLAPRAAVEDTDPVHAVRPAQSTRPAVEEVRLPSPRTGTLAVQAIARRPSLGAGSSISATANSDEYKPPGAEDRPRPTVQTGALSTQPEPEPTATATPSATRTPSPPEATGTAAAREEGTPIFIEHEVQAGHTVTSIAGRYGISPDYIVWNNVDVLDDANALAIGMVLQIPSVEGIIHSVRVGETVSGIAARYDAEIDDIVGFEANGFNGDPDNLHEGAQILVPGGRPATTTPVASGSESEAPGSLPEPADEEPDPAGETAGQTGWAWPTAGLITSFFGPDHPLGIDIGVDIGTPTVAAAAGQVVFAGGNPCCSYGSHVIIEHAGGIETLYAHLSDFAVSLGEWVEVGQVIGWSGSSGRSTGPHLHFEIRTNGIYEDPIGYLP